MTPTREVKRTKNHRAFIEIANLSKTLFIILSIIVGIILMLVAFWLASSPEVRDPSIVNWGGAIGQEILIAIGTSIISSIIFFALYSMSAEEKVLKEISENAAETATDYAISLFQKRFESMLPLKIFQATNAPVEEFDKDFYGFLNKSKIYYHKGETASFASYRLAYFAQKGRPLDQDTVILVLDPRRKDLFEERAKNELTVSHQPFSKIELLDRADELRRDIFVTMMTLFDIRYSTRVEFGFHQEHLFFRSEIMDDAIFLTYYLGGEFPGTYLYTQSTFTYKAFYTNFRQNFDAADIQLVFRPGMSDEDFRAILDKLGCESSAEELRVLVNQRSTKYQKLLNF